MFLVRTAAALLLLAAATPAPAETAPPPPQRMTTVLVYGNDACPKGVGDEIVVCARRPEGERYRIPPKLRGKKILPSEGSWTNTVASLDDVSRTQMMPDSCSPNGSNGQTGCTMKMLHQWYQERKQEKADAAGIP